MNKEFIFKGGTKSTITIIDNKILIKRKGFNNFVNQGLKGEKTIFIKNISSVQIKKNGLTNGYIQFSLIGGGESKGGIFAATKDENTVMFGRKGEYEKALEIKQYIESFQDEPESSNKQNDINQIRELKSLLDDGIITQEEFNMKKKNLLGI